MSSNASQHPEDDRHGHWYTPHAHRGSGNGAEYPQGGAHNNEPMSSSSHHAHPTGTSTHYPPPPPPPSGAYPSSASSQGRPAHGQATAGSPGESGSAGHYQASPSSQAQYSHQPPPHHSYSSAGYSRYMMQSRGPHPDPRYAGYEYSTGGRDSVGPEEAMRYQQYVDKSGHSYYQHASNSQGPPPSSQQHSYYPPPGGEYPPGPPMYSYPTHYSYQGRYYPYSHAPPPHSHYGSRGGATYPGYEYPPDYRMGYDPRSVPPGQPHQATGRPDSRPYEERRFTFPSLSNDKSGEAHPGPSRSPSPVIPPPPAGNDADSPSTTSSVQRDEKSAQNDTTTGGGPLRESRLHNRNQDSSQSPGAKTSKSGVKKKQAVDAASILLEFQKTSKSNSPATTVDSVDDQNQSHLKPKVSTDADENEGLASSMADANDNSPPSAIVVEKERPYPVPVRYPSRLALPSDKTKLNKLHCFLRSELLEVFVIDAKTHENAQSSVGRVGLRCVHCAMNRKALGDVPQEEAAMAVFYPKTVAEIYRLVTSWQRCHLRKCRTLPPPVRAEWQDLREKDKSRGKTNYWISSAKEIGLVDIPSKAGGIRFSVSEKEEEEFLQQYQEQSVVRQTSSDTGDV